MFRYVYESVELPANTWFGVRYIVVYEFPGFREE